MKSSSENQCVNHEAQLIEQSDHIRVELAVKKSKLLSHNMEEYPRISYTRNYLPPPIFKHSIQSQLHAKNKKMLPGLRLRRMVPAKLVTPETGFSTQGNLVNDKTIKCSRNSQILNSLIDILKSDPDQEPKPRLKTLPAPCLNQFIESRQIFSVKSSVRPKIVNKAIILPNSQRNCRNLVSEEKNRIRVHYRQDTSSFSASKPTPTPSPVYEDMDLTFYRPRPVQIIESEMLKSRRAPLNNEFIS